MGSGRNSAEADLPLRVLERIEKVCQRFEEAWESGSPLRIEDLLTDFQGAARHQLLYELLLLELHYQCDDVTRRQCAQFRARFPADSSVVDSAIASIVAD